MKTNSRDLIRNILLGKRYFSLTSVDEQVKYMAMNSIFAFSTIPLILLGLSMVGIDTLRVGINLGIATLCFIALIMIRTKVALSKVPILPVTIFAAYCAFLVFLGDYDLWGAVWVLTLPPIAIFLCGLVVGVFQSVIVIIAAMIFLNTPFAPVDVGFFVQLRFLFAFFLILGLTIIYERIRLIKEKKEALLISELARERFVIETMKDNIHQGIFLMDTDLKILPLYSRPLISILSYYDSELTGKSFLDILSASLDGKQLQTMKGYFSMIFSKSKSTKVLESVNPIADFEYRVDDRTKVLSTKFHLIEQAGSEPLIIGIINDITKEKEFERELEVQKETQEQEMKNVFDIIRIDPVVFNDFIEDAEAKFNAINEILKDRTLTEKQVVTKLFQNVHAMKSNALILGLEVFGKKLHGLEDEIKTVLDASKVELDDVLSLVVKLETIMQEKDTYVNIINRIQSYRRTHNADAAFVNFLKTTVGSIAKEVGKNVEFKAGQIDVTILTSNLRKPLKDILLQCIRNSIYHGIESEEERIKKGKQPQGLLTANIKNVDGKAEITFSDDGRGLDWEKIKTKYLKLHPEAKEINKKVLLSAIFSPEFSTSDDTNMIAGRGIGLNLIKDLVNEYQGSINVNSSEAGLTFRFLMPFTAQKLQ